jgi:hypothetical protein
MAVSAPRQASGYLMTKKGYLHPMKTYLWITIFLTGLMSALWFAVGIGPGAQGTIPPWFIFGASDLYFHSIAIGIGSIIAILVIMAFDLERHEPRIDFPIAYRATLGTIIGAIGGFLYLRPVFHVWLAPIPIAFIFVGLLFLADVGGALLLQLYFLPGKISGRYDSTKNILGMIPRWKTLPTWGDFRKMDGTYWLTFVSVAGTFIAGVIGFVVFWLNYFVMDLNISPSVFNGYIAWLGGAATFMDAAMGAHSHVIGITLIVGLVAVTAKRFGVLDLSGPRRSVTRVGLWVSGIGIAVMTFVYLLEAFAAYTPPLLFASDPGGSFQLWSFTAANGMAGDDSTMWLASLGAIIMLIPLFLTPIRGRPAWKDPLRMSILATWVLAYIATPIEGFFIEFNEATLSGGPTDVVFGNQQYFALFGITMVAAAFLAVDFFQDRRGSRSVLAGLGFLVTFFTVVAGFIWAYFDPGVLNPDGSLAGITNWGWVYAAGLFLISVVVIAATAAILRGADEPMTPPVTQA